MASSPRIVVSTVSRRVSSPQPVKNFLTVRKNLSPRTPTKGERQSLLYVDTPNRAKILKYGPPEVEEPGILGCGGFGTVYKACYKGSHVAAKVLRHRRSSDATLKAERNAVFLSHSNIIRILGIEVGNICSLITMELCGDSLQEKLNETCLTRGERIDIWRAIACALEFCHNAGIVHADVKPKNILIGADGQPKLADFGSSIIIDEEYPSSTGLKGTPGYVAPEIVKGNRPSIASDIYSLGILAWQMLSGESPFPGHHPHTILYLTGKGMRPADELLNDECNGNYKNLYRELWSQIPESRPSISVIIDCLDKI